MIKNPIGHSGGDDGHRKLQKNLYSYRESAVNYGNGLF